MPAAVHRAEQAHLAVGQAELGGPDGEQEVDDVGEAVVHEVDGGGGGEHRAGASARGGVIAGRRSRPATRPRVSAGHAYCDRISRPVTGAVWASSRKRSSGAIVSQRLRRGQCVLPSAPAGRSAIFRSWPAWSRSCRRRKSSASRQVSGPNMPCSIVRSGRPSGDAARTRSKSASRSRASARHHSSAGRAARSGTRRRPRRARAGADRRGCSRCRRRNRRPTPPRGPSPRRRSIRPAPAAR